MTEPELSQNEGRALGGGAIATIAGGGVLLIFILQNRESVRFHFLGWDFTWPLWLYTLIVAAVGALIWLGAGIVRRHRRRTRRRAARRGEAGRS